jgi:hypothetical protein
VGALSFNADFDQGIGSFLVVSGSVMMPEADVLVHVIAPAFVLRFPENLHLLAFVKCHGNAPSDRTVVRVGLGGLRRAQTLHRRRRSSLR